MSKLDNFISKFRVVRVRSRKLTIIVLVVAIVLSMIALAALHLSMQWLSARTDALRDQAAHLEGENAALQDLEPRIAERSSESPADSVLDRNQAYREH